MTKRPIAVDDFKKFELPSNATFSPDGQRVIYEVSIANEKEDDYDVQLHLASITDESSRVLTRTGSKNASPIWSPDGQTIAFLSNRALGTQVWLLPTAGGEAEPLTFFKMPIRALQFSSDGRTLYGLVPAAKGGDVEVWEKDTTDKEAKEHVDKIAKEFADSPKRYQEIYYKSDGTGLSRGFASQLVAIDVASGTHRQLTKSNRNVTAFSVSPDNTEVAYTVNLRENRDLDWWYSDIYRVSTQGGEAQIWSDQLIAHHLSYSPDGKYLAVFGNSEELYQYKSAAHRHLFVLSRDGETMQHLTKHYPDTLGDTCLTDMRGNSSQDSLKWSVDGRHVYSLASREGRCGVVQIPLDTAEADIQTIIGGDRDVFGFDFDGQNRFVITYATPTHPGRVVVVDALNHNGKTSSDRSVTEAMTETATPFFPETEVRLDTCSEEILNEVLVVEPEAFWYTSADNWRVQGWVMKPAEYRDGAKYPVLLEVHGGPQLNYGYAIFHEMQWFAAQGYAVVFVNPRGGMSYGQEFVDAVRHHYGENDAADVMNGLDAALARFDFLDGQRVALTGGSYGGFMTNWLVGHTNRFFAAVSQRSISNWISFFGVSDIGPLFVEWQHGGTIYSHFDYLWKISPLTYAEQVTTPLLLVHSENDLRCPIEQAEQFHTALRRLNKEVEIFRIPNASHGLSRNGKPKLRIERLQAIFDWIHTRLPQA